MKKNLNNRRIQAKHNLITKHVPAIKEALAGDFEGLDKTAAKERKASLEKKLARSEADIDILTSRIRN